MNSTFNKLKRMLYDKFSFHYDQIQIETKLELELGMDSRELIELLNEIEQIFEININLDEIDDIVSNGKTLSINDIVNYIDKKSIE